MPPKVKITKENIISTAVEIVRESGAEALNARALAAKLGCSTQPIFSNFSSMEEIRGEVIRSADEIYQSCIRNEVEQGDFPPYKASGMAYIRFAEDEKELFKLLFMRDRTGEETGNGGEAMENAVAAIMKNTGLDYERAYMFHIEMWVYVHGIATMLATGYLNWDWELISKMLTDAYEGMKKRYMDGKEQK
ncbi:MAG: TetR/AcrR family transcriptional regulator [Oscillospiraceae bacterium]